MLSDLDGSLTNSTSRCMNKNRLPFLNLGEPNKCIPSGAVDRWDGSCLLKGQAVRDQGAIGCSRSMDSLVSSMPIHSNPVADLEFGYRRTNAMNNAGSIEPKFRVGNLSHGDHDFAKARGR